MANREKGEHGMTIGGKEYTLVMGINEMVLLEDQCSRAGVEVTFTEILERLKAGSVRHQRAFIWAALQRHHPELTIAAVGDLIEAAGGLIAFSAQLVRLAGGTNADARDLEALGIKPSRPRRARAVQPDGTGTDSTVTPAASA